METETNTRGPKLDKGLGRSPCAPILVTNISISYPRKTSYCNLNGHFQIGISCGHIYVDEILFEFVKGQSRTLKTHLLLSSPLAYTF